MQALPPYATTEQENLQYAGAHLMLVKTDN